MGRNITDPELLKRLNSDDEMPKSTQSRNVTDPALLSRLNAPEPEDIPGLQNTREPKPQEPYSFTKDVTESIKNLGKDVMIAGHKLAWPNDESYAAKLGMENPTLQNKIIQGFLEYGPYAALGATPGAMLGRAGGALSQMAGQGGAGAIYAARHNENPAIGAMAGTLGEGVGMLAEKALIEPLKKMITQSAAAPIKEKIQNAYNVDRAYDANLGFAHAEERYPQFVQNEKNAWSNLDGAIGYVDSLPNKYKFDRTKYDDELIQYGKEVQRKLKQTPEDKGLQATDKFITQKLDNPINNFGQVVEHQKGLNRSYVASTEGNSDVPLSAIKHVQEIYRRNVNDSLQQNNLGRVRQAWDEANEATQQKNRIFHEITNESGKTSPSKFINFMNNKSEFADPSSFVSDYIPNFKRQAGTQKFDQFRQLVGNKEVADNVLKKQIFEDTSAEGFLNKYREMSPAQQADLFTAKERKLINSAAAMQERNPKIFSSEKAEKTWLEKYLPALGILGGMGTSFLKGTPLSATMTTGAGAGYFGKLALQGLAEMIGKNPLGIRAVQNKALGRRGIEDELRHMLTDNFTQKITVPEVTRENME